MKTPISKPIAQPEFTVFAAAVAAMFAGALAFFPSVFTNIKSQTTNNISESRKMTIEESPPPSLVFSPTVFVALSAPRHEAPIAMDWVAPYHTLPRETTEQKIYNSKLIIHNLFSHTRVAIPPPPVFAKMKTVSPAPAPAKKSARVDVKFNTDDSVPDIFILTDD